MSWNLKKIAGQAASKVSAVAGKVNFQFPNIPVTIEPGKSAQISTGYQISSLPPNTIMHTAANPDLIAKGLLTFPKLSKSGEITQTVLNLSKKVFKIIPRSQGTPALMLQSVDNCLQTQNLTDIGSFFSGIVGGIGSFFANLF